MLIRKLRARLLSLTLLAETLSFALFAGQSALVRHMLGGLARGVSILAQIHTRALYVCRARTEAMSCTSLHEHCSKAYADGLKLDEVWAAVCLYIC